VQASRKIRVTLFDRLGTVFSGRTFYLMMILGCEPDPLNRLARAQLDNFDSSAG
jgi:hypothetical protein